MRSFDEDIKKRIGEYGSIPFWSWNEKIEKRNYSEMSMSYIVNN